MSLNEAAQTLTQPELEHDEATDFVPAPGVMEKIAELRREWSGIVAGVESLAEKMVSFRRDIDAAGADLPLPDREVIGLLQKVRDCVILESMPHAPCPCRQDGVECKTCGGCRMLPKRLFDKLPLEQRRRVPKKLVRSNGG